LIITEPGREDEVVTRLARVGFDNVLGFLKGGFLSWTKEGREVDTIVSVSASVLSSEMKKGKVPLIDVRKKGEYEAEHAVDALNIPLDVLNQHLSEIPKDRAVFIQCAGGYRSMIACSILKARGWENIVDVDGGFKALAATDIPCTDYVCATAKNKK
jgi:rhodanese-related sulfurtransferase